MKRILAVAMIAGLIFTSSISLCFGAETVNAKVDVVASVSTSFKISEKIAVKGHAYSRTVTVDPLTVTNLTTSRVITIKNIQAKGQGKWTMASSAAVDAAAKDTRFIYLAMEDNGTEHDLSISGGYNVIDGEVAIDDGTRKFPLSGKIPPQKSTTAAAGTDVAKLVVTVSIAPTKINGFSVEYLQNSVAWDTGTDAEITAVVKAIDAGVVDADKLTGWDVGTSRNVTITPAEGSAYTAKLVIWDANTGNTTAAAQYALTDQTGDTYEKTGKTASFIVGIEGLTDTSMVMNSTRTNEGSWGSSEGRTTVNAIYSTLPTAIQGILKPFETRTANSYNQTSGALQGVSDYLALPAAKEVYGGTATSAGLATGGSNLLEFQALTQFAYFKNKNPAERIRYLDGVAKIWWLRSPYSTGAFAGVSQDGNSNGGGWYTEYSGKILIPFGCI